MAAAIARATNGELMLLAVEPDLPLLIPGLDRKTMRKETETMLRTVRESLTPRPRTVVKTGLSVPRALEHAVRSEHRDLLVVGSSRHGPDGQVSLGKRTRQLLDDFQCSLAVAPRGFSERPDVQFHRIGVGYDGGPESEAALQLAASIAATCRAELIVRGVVDDHIPALGWPRVWLGAIMASWEETISTKADSLREQIAAAESRFGLTAQADVELGRPSELLLKLSQDVDLLVIGSRRWGAGHPLAPRRNGRGAAAWRRLPDAAGTAPTRCSSQSRECCADKPLSPAPPFLTTNLHQPAPRIIQRYVADKGRRDPGSSLHIPQARPRRALRAQVSV